MEGEGVREVGERETLLRLVHASQVVDDGDGGRRLSSQALVFPRVAHDDRRDGVSVYVEGMVESLGRRAVDLIGAKGFDEVWSADSGETMARSGEAVVEDPADEGFWADPAHALILTPVGATNNQRKKVARRLAPIFTQVTPS